MIMMVMMWNLRFTRFFFFFIINTPNLGTFLESETDDASLLGPPGRCVVSQNRGEGARLVDSLIWMRVCCVVSSLRTNIKSVVIHTVHTIWSKSECVQIQLGLHVVIFPFSFTDSRCSPRIPLLWCVFSFTPKSLDRLFLKLNRCICDGWFS